MVNTSMSIFHTYHGQMVVLGHEYGYFTKNGASTLENCPPLHHFLLVSVTVALLLDDFEFLAC